MRPWSNVFDLPKQEATITTLEKEAAGPDFWNDSRQAQTKMRQLTRAKETVERWQGLQSSATSLLELVELALEEGEFSLQDQIEDETAQITQLLAKEEVNLTLSGIFDDRSAIISIHAGVGGTDSHDWAEMLMRMYTRWSERRGFAVQILDLQPAEEAGIKSATLEIIGESAYGYLKAEGGVHRLVRISPFDQQSRRHTSFASVFVYPQVDDDIEIEIDESDLRVDTYRASGAGGQHVNKTDSAVRLTHHPTGIVVTCQQERSQHKNRSTAMKMLKAQLYQHALQEKERERAVLEATKTEIGFGNQIRSYVFQPYTMVNDHRTELKLTDVHKVMDGDIDPFIEAYLKKIGSAAG